MDTKIKKMDLLSKKKKKRITWPSSKKPFKEEESGVKYLKR